MSSVDDFVQETSYTIGGEQTTRPLAQKISGQFVCTQPLQATQADMVARQSSNRFLAVPCSDIMRVLTGASSQATTTALRIPIAMKAEPEKVASGAHHLQGKHKFILALLAPLLLLLIMGGTILAASPLSRDTPSGSGLNLRQAQQANDLVQSKSSNLNNLTAHATSTPVPHQSPASSHSAANVPSTNGNSSANTSSAATSSGSLGWPVGQCTYWANERYHELSGYWVSWHGDAGDWVDGARQASWAVSTTPHIPSIIVLLPGVEGASSSYGHVAVAEKLLNSTTVEASTMNWFANGGGFDIQSTWNYSVGDGVYFVWHP